MFKNISLKKSKRFLFVVFSDTHAGHLLGLLNPDVTFKEWDENGDRYDYKPALTKNQIYLWNLYMDNLERVKELAKGCPIIVLHNGDLTVGLKYPTQMSFTALSNQIIAAAYNMYPIMKLPNLKAFRLTYGTQSHEMYEGTAPKIVITKLESEFKDAPVKLVKMGKMEVGELEFNYAHHGPFPGSRKWLEGNNARYYLRDLMMRKILAGHKPANFNFYGHYHTTVEEKLTIPANGNIYRSYLFITPSYQMMGDYAMQATRSVDSVTNGMLALECDEHELLSEPHWFTETKDIRTKEKIEL